MVVESDAGTQEPHHRMARFEACASSLGTLRLLRRAELFAVVHAVVCFWPFSKNLPSRWARRVLFLLSARALCCFAKQIAGDGAQDSCSGGQLLVNLGSYHCPSVKQLGGKYERRDRQGAAAGKNGYSEEGL